MADVTAEGFDQWYADMVGSPVKDEIQRRHLGLPPHLLSTSLLSWEGIAEVAAALQLKRGDTLLDLACGRGGYGLEISGRTGARLVGVSSRTRPWLPKPPRWTPARTRLSGPSTGRACARWGPGTSCAG